MTGVEPVSSDPQSSPLPACIRYRGGSLPLYKVDGMPSWPLWLCNSHSSKILLTFYFLRTELKTAIINTNSIIITYKTWKVRNKTVNTPHHTSETAHYARYTSKFEHTTEPLHTPNVESNPPPPTWRPDDRLPSWGNVLCHMRLGSHLYPIAHKWLF